MQSFCHPKLVFLIQAYDSIFRKVQKYLKDVSLISDRQEWWNLYTEGLISGFYIDLFLLGVTPFDVMIGIDVSTVDTSAFDTLLLIQFYFLFLFLMSFIVFIVFAFDASGSADVFGLSDVSESVEYFLKINRLSIHLLLFYFIVLYCKFIYSW